ncbi:MAG: hypothetical protein V8S96_02875 [Lachnospiraceae bacterium]
MKRRIKRLAAAGLAAGMVLTLPATALAEFCICPHNRIAGNRKRTGCLEQPAVGVR